MSYEGKGVFEDVNLQTGRIQRQIIHYGTEPSDGIWSGSSLKRPALDNIREEGAMTSKRTVTLTSNGRLPVKVPFEIPVRLTWALPLEESQEVVNSVSYDTIIPGGLSLPSDSFHSSANEDEELVTRGDEDHQSPDTRELVTSGDFFSTAGGPVASSSSEYQYQGFVSRNPYNMTRFLETMCI